MVVDLVTLLVAVQLNCQQLFHIKIKAKACEDVWVEIGLDRNEYLSIGSIYRHPSNDFRCFEEYFANILKSLRNKQKYIVMGDVSIHYDKITSSQNIAQIKFSLYWSLYQLGFSELVEPIAATCTKAHSARLH